MKPAFRKNFPFLIAMMLCVTFASETSIDANNTFSFYTQNDKDLQTGIASWYSRHSPGINKHTANNEIFDDTDLTAAMWDVPFHQKVRVTNLDNGKSVTVRINDRGPNQRFVRRGRIIDLTKKAFGNIAPLHEGLIHIELEFL